MKKILTAAAMILSVSATAQDSSKNNPLSFTGYVEAYYSYDFNKPTDNNKPAFIYSHNRHNEFNVNLAFIKASYSADRVRGNLAIAAGTYMNANYSSEPGVLKNIFEADAGYKVSKDKNLWFDIGIMPSHIGFESAVSKDCWTLTRSILADNTPYFESGAKLTYTTDSSKWLFSGMALNGWQRITRVNGNSLMSWGTQIQFKPNDKVLINYSTFFGTDKPDSARLWRYFHNFYGVFQFSNIVGLTLGFDIGQEQKSKNSSAKNTWFSPVAIVRITANDKWAFALRSEYYDDENGVIIPVAIGPGTPDGFKTAGFSANIDYLPLKNVAIRLEGKTLHSKDKIFIKNNGTTNNNSSITFSTAISF